MGADLQGKMLILVSDLGGFSISPAGVSFISLFLHFTICLAKSACRNVGFYKVVLQMRLKKVVTNFHF